MENEVETGPRVHDVVVRVCQDCIDLKGQECHVPECVFCFKGMDEAKWLLDKMLICPIIDGERIILAGDAVEQKSATSSLAVEGESRVNELARKICKRPRAKYAEDWSAVKALLMDFHASASSPSSTEAAQRAQHFIENHSSRLGNDGICADKRTIIAALTTELATAQVVGEQRMRNALILAADFIDPSTDPLWVSHADMAAMLRDAAASTSLDSAALAKLRNANRLLRLILPMAKGYAVAHPVGSNEQFISETEEFLESL